MNTSILKKYLAIGLLFMSMTVFGQYLSITNPPSNISLVWNPSPTINYGALSYYIWVGPSSLSYTNKISAGTNLTLTVSNLVRGSGYFFNVTPYATNGLEGPWDGEVNYMSPVPPLSTSGLKILNAN